MQNLFYDISRVFSFLKQILAFWWFSGRINILKPQREKKL